MMLSNVHYLYSVVMSLGLVFFSCRKTPSSKDTPHIIERDGSIHVKGIIYPERYNNHRNRAQGHHGIVWKNGRASGKALIETEASDPDILHALIEAGAEPGNNLPKEAWLERNDPGNPAPDLIVEGTGVDILLSWEGLEEPLLLQALLTVTGGAEFLPRTGGHEDQIDYWKSGCVMCLFSCPGGRTSNAGATIRQQAQREVEWRAREDILPPDGTPVDIIFTINKL